MEISIYVMRGSFFRARFGARGGALVGGLSGFLLDLFSGYPQYMLFSLVIHGTQGALVGTAQTRSLKEQLLVCGERSEF